MNALKTIPLIAILLTAQSYADTLKDESIFVIRDNHIKTLVWKIPQKNFYRTLPIQLLPILEKQFGFPCIVSRGNLHYLAALQDSGIEGAKELIEIINQFGQIELNLE